MRARNITITCHNVLIHSKELNEKIDPYTRAGWWTESTTEQAAPMLCIPKKNGKLHTIVDYRQRNANTVKDVTPFPDQDNIRQDVAKHKYRSKIDMSDAYEQIRNEVQDVWKTAFSTTFGTYLSNVMMQGDCNAPATFQHVMTHIFRDLIGKCVHVYLDDIFIFSTTIEEHERILEEVFRRLQEQHLYLKAEKCKLYAKVMDALGHVIDDKGIHADVDKMDRVRQWSTPKNFNDVQRFLGLVQYVAPYMPDVANYTSPLSNMTRNNVPFHSVPVHDSCFDNIKHLALKAPILKPIDPQKNKPIWVICDASVSGVGAMYGQGPTWQTCCPAGFMSKKFTSAQHNYRVFELETLAILEALLKWEDKLLGYRIHVVTDH